MVVIGFKKKILDGCVAKIAPNGWDEEVKTTTYKVID